MVLSEMDSENPEYCAKLPNSAANELHQSNAEKKKKLRRRSQKMPALNNISSKKKNAAALILKSAIPRDLTVKTSLKPSPKPSSKLSINPSVPLLSKSLSLPSNAAKPCMQLQRQKSSIPVLNFCNRMSTSQLNIKHNRRDGAPALPPLPRYKNDESSVASGEDVDNAGLIIVASNQSAVVDDLLKRSEYCYELKNTDSKIAGIRIFTSIMLNAWRKRRNEVKTLTAELSDLKRASVKTKNQLHVVLTLYRIEQKHNDELNTALKLTKEENKVMKDHCEKLNSSIISVKAGNAELEQKLRIKEEEFDGLNLILSETKSELFKSMSMHRKLQSDLADKQRKAQMLLVQKAVLVNEYSNLFNESAIKIEQFLAVLNVRDDEIKKLKADIKLLEELHIETKNKELRAREYSALEAKLRSEIESLQTEIQKQKQFLDSTIGNRLKKCWKNSLGYQSAMLHIVHWVVYYMLPATPRPRNAKFPYGLSLEKALSIVKR